MVVETIVAYIISQAQLQGVEPDIAIAVAKTESVLNPKKVGRAGEIGIYQLHPKFWPTSKTDWKRQVRDGVKVLAHFKGRCKPFLGNFWFICFNVGEAKARLMTPVMIGKGPYSRRVMSYASAEE